MEAGFNSSFVGNSTKMEGHGDSVARVARTLLPHVDDLAALSLTVTRAQEPAYRTLVAEDDPELGRCGIAFVLHQLAATKINDDRLDAPELVGRRRAEQGVPLEAVLHAFRIDFRTVWEAMLEVVRDQGGQALEPFVLGVTRVWETIDTISLRVSSAYREAESAIATQRRERREHLLASLLHGRGSLSAVSREVANEFGFTETGIFVLMVVQGRAGEHDPFANPELVLGNANIRSAWRTDTTQQVGIVEQHKHVDDLIDSLRPYLQRRAGVSPEFHRLADARDNLWLAEIASRTIPSGQAGIGTTSRSLPASFAAAAPELAQYGRKSVLGPLDRLRADERDRLLQALAVFLEHDGSLTEAANEMHVHRNTLFGYLRRLTEITGKDPHKRRDMIDYGLALAAHRIYGSDE